jgi:hypothetical protein
MRTSRVLAFTSFALLVPVSGAWAQAPTPTQKQKQRKAPVQQPSLPPPAQTIPIPQPPYGYPAAPAPTYPGQPSAQPQFPQQPAYPPSQYPQQPQYPQPARPPQQYQTPPQYQQQLPQPVQYQQQLPQPVRSPQQYQQPAGYPPPQASNPPAQSGPYPQQPLYPNSPPVPAYAAPQQAYPPGQLQPAAARQGYPQMQPYSAQPQSAAMPGQPFDGLGLVAEDEAQELPRFAITLSPFHLSLPVLQLTGEYRLGEQMGIAAILGAGEIKGAASGLYEAAPTYTAFEAGAKFHYYAVGNFRHGMQVGGEVLMIHVSGSNKGISESATGLLVGPFLGYKYTAGFGLTVEAQLGLAREGIGASASTGDELTKSGWGALLNLNAGWSF